MRADRLLSIIMLLQTRGKMTTRVLAQETGVSRRTILRDIEALSMAGVPIYAEGGHGGGVDLDENYRTTLTGLQESEALTLFISSHGKSLSDVGLDDAADRTLLKLLAALPMAHRPSVEHIRQRILIDPDWWWQEQQPTPFWDILQQAVYEDLQIRVIYENHQGDIAERILEPYSLVAKSSLWYLIAARAGDLRTYRVSRFHHVELLNEHFSRQTDFDLPRYWGAYLQSFSEHVEEYHFTLSIHPDKLSFIKTLMPGRVHILEAEDEWITVHCHMESIIMAKILILELGSQVEIIEPKNLRDIIIEQVNDLSEFYEIHSM